MIVWTLIITVMIYGVPHELIEPGYPTHYACVNAMTTMFYEAKYLPGTSVVSYTCQPHPI